MINHFDSKEYVLSVDYTQHIGLPTLGKMKNAVASGVVIFAHPICFDFGEVTRVINTDLIEAWQTHDDGRDLVRKEVSLLRHSQLL